MYVIYEVVFGVCGVWVVLVLVCFENGFCVQVEEVVVLIILCMCVMVLNSLYNLFGVSLLWVIWEVLVELCMVYDLWMIFDEVYSELLFDGEYVSLVSLLGMVDCIVIFNSLLKFYVMIGWWVGWVVGFVVFCVYLENFVLCMFYGLLEFIQDVVCIVLEVLLLELEVMCEVYCCCCDLVIECLVDSFGLCLLCLDGGMFVMVDICFIGFFVQVFVDCLLDCYGVLVFVGEVFGLSVVGYICFGLVLGVELLCEVCWCIVLCVVELFGQV